MNVLSLFSGIGGIDVAVKLVLPGAKTVAYVERDKYCQVLLKARMNDGSLDTAPIIDDVRDASVASIPDIDIIIGGFPCQPFSFAGLRKEQQDERNLWPTFNELIRSVRPRYVFLENVPGILTSRQHEAYIYTILKDLNQGGYDAEWGTIKASDIGAPHKRERWFCLAWRRDLADPHQERLQGGFGYTGGKEREDGTSVEHDRNDIRSETGRSSRTLGNPTSQWTRGVSDTLETERSQQLDGNTTSTSGVPLGNTIDTGDTSPEHGADRHRQTQEQDEHQLSFAELTGSDFSMDDTQYLGQDEPQESGSIRQRGSSPSKEQKEPRQPTRPSGSSDRHQQMADTTSDGFDPSKSGVIREDYESSSSGEDAAEAGRHTPFTQLADTNSQGFQRTEHRAFDDVATTDKGELADTDSEGSQGIRCTEQGEPCETSEALLQRNAFIEHEFPPGPTDYDGWARVLSEMPEVEPSFCIEADGISTSLVISRTQSLKMLGNSVVPQQVAAALTVLWNRMVNA